MNPKRIQPVLSTLGALSALCAALLLGACEGGGSTSPDASSDKAALLVGKEWTLTASVSEPGYRNEKGELVTDLLAGDPESCVDVYPFRFEAGGRFPASTIQSKCGDEDASQPAGAWSLKSGGSVLVIDFDGEIPPLEYEVVTLTEKNLKISMSIEAMGDMPARKIIQTYTAQ